MTHSKAQIVATIGPASFDKEIMKKMIDAQMDVARLNFSWGKYEEHALCVKNIREASAEAGRRIPIIADLSGPRIQEEKGHEFNKSAVEVITDKDLKDLEFALSQDVDYIAMSFVGGASDIIKLREDMKKDGKVIPIIAKIERKIAVEKIDEIIAVTDAIMVARGDMGNEVPLEEIPFIEKDIIERCKKAGKPVIVATQMMFTMKDNPTPTRAEVTDVTYAVTSGADAVMLSEETANGKYPVETVAMMERINVDSEEHFKNIKINQL